MTRSPMFIVWEPSVIPLAVLGDEGPLQCEGCSTCRAPSAGCSPDNSQRQFTSLPMNCRSAFARRAQDLYNTQNNRKGFLNCGDSAEHCSKGTISCREAQVKNHKRKLNHGERSDINLAKLPRWCHNSDVKLENDNMQMSLGTEQLDTRGTPLPQNQDHKIMQKNLAKQNNGQVEIMSSCCSSERRLVQASLMGDNKGSISGKPMKCLNHLEGPEKSPVAFPVNSTSNPNNQNWRAMNGLLMSQDDQKMDILKGPL
ncbi:uncharacterized protein [Heterodontus francisci]|uniref:uncharacterized protein n=1 Tax=Heterodontus francisci TaxID=7792 RepID=UPI00355AEED2